MERHRIGRTLDRGTGSGGRFGYEYPRRVIGNGTAWWMVPASVFSWWLIGWATVVWAVEGPLPSPLANAEGDAALHGVWFTDADRGWVVGDRGVIWRTVDGGRSWQRQPSGVSCRFDAVTFSPDGRVGCIVGGWTRPYTGESVGVVLRTEDGGETWSPVATPTLPLLFYVQLITGTDGLALGAQSAMHPWCVFRTGDGGRSWSAVPLGSSGQLVAAGFSSPEQGVLAAEDGRLLMLVSGRAVPCRSGSTGGKLVRAITVSSSTGWLVGDSGLVMRTPDAGVHWEAVSGMTADGSEQWMDFRAVAMHGNHCWIAGAPGGVIFHTVDGGKTWTRSLTGVHVPIYALHFLDENRGWAVGALGTILGTRDGGKTWWTLRSGGERLAAMVIWPDPATAPWEWLGWYGADQGYVTGATFLGTRPGENMGRWSWVAMRRAEEAVVSAGGAVTAFTPFFPLPQRGINLAEQDLRPLWNQLHDGKAEDRLEQYLVRQFRQWKCDVVVLADKNHSSPDPLLGFLQRLTLRAVERAADATAYPELTSLGLAPWRVQKVTAWKAASGSASLGPLRVDGNQLSAVLGRSVGDFVAPVKALVQAGAADGATSWQGQFLVDLVPQQLGAADVFSGLRYGAGTARRPAAAPASTNLEALSRITQKRRAVEKLIQPRTGTTTLDAALTAQLEDLTSGLPLDMASVLLYQLGQSYVASGQWESAAQVYERLSEGNPDHDLANAATAWLVAYYASAEVGWNLRRQTQVHAMVVTAAAESATLGHAATTGESAESPYHVQAASGTAAPQFRSHIRAKQALDVAARLSARDVGLFQRPEIRFPWSVAQRAVGQNREADSFVDQLATRGADTAWRACAQAEQWLRHGRGLPPKPVATCPRAVSLPYLDGALTDEVWQRSQPLPLHSPWYEDQAWPCFVQVAYDDQFLYLAVQARRTTRDTYPAVKGLRQRDTDLSEYDRVELFLDIDRDYMTYYRLSIDSRGCPSDACWGDVSWNPQWYIAVKDDGETWTAEAAISWEDVAPQPPKTNHAWAFQVHRVAPRTGFQAWSQPASVEVIPRGFGLLLFQ